MTTERKFELVIVGGGVTGTALAYVLSRYTNVRRILLLEKNPWVGQVNSHPMNNAQTSHDGGTETNYTLEHAHEVQRSAVMLRRYCESKGDPLLFQKSHRMALAVDAGEVADLKKRFEEFKPTYPDLFFAGPEELARIEPKIMDGRDPKEPVCAMVSTEGYIVNYQRLAETLLSDARKLNPDLEVLFNTKTTDIRKEDADFILRTQAETFRASSVAFASGSYSLFFAQKLGYGLDYAILPVAGSFFSGGPLLNGKVYRMQIPGMPFAAIHGDPDILNMHDTRFGPTTKPLPLMERHRYRTAMDFVHLPLISSVRGWWSLAKILSGKRILGYALKHMLYDLPIIGKALFLREVRPIIPTIRYKDLKLRRGAGGIRPQIVDLKTGTLIMGDVTIKGDKCIFNTTPSPGASVCIANAKRDTARIVQFLGRGYAFDEKGFDRELLGK